MENNDALRITPHPIYIVKLIYPYLTLLIIPIIKGVVGYLTDNKQELPSFFTAEIFLIFIIFAVSLAKLKRMQISISDSIRIKRGLLCRTFYEIGAVRSKVIVVEENPYLSRMGIYRLKIYTEAGNQKKADEDIPIRSRDAKALCKRFGCKGLRFIGRNSSNVFMAASSSSVMAGLLIAAPIVKSVAGVLGKGIKELVPELEKAKGIYTKSTELGLFISIILLVGYSISFGVIILRNIGFKAAIDKRAITLKGGVFPNRSIFFEKSSVNSVCILSPPIMRMVGKCLVKFNSCGYGRSAGELAVLIPCESVFRVDKSLAKMFPNIKAADSGIRPKRVAVFRCVFLPMTLVTVAVVLCELLSRLIYYADTVISLIAVTLGVINIIYIVVRLDTLLNGKFIIDDKFVTMRAKKGISAAKLTAELRDVHCFTLFRTPFDFRKKTCKIKVAVYSKNREKIALSYLSYEKARQYILKSIRQ